MTAKLLIYQHFILRLCNADLCTTHAPTRTSARSQRVYEAVAVYAANQADIEAAMKAESEARHELPRASL